MLVLAVCVLCVLAPLAAQAKPDTTAFIPKSLLEAVTAHPDAVYKVVVQGEGATDSRAVADAVEAETADDPGRGKGLKRKFVSISGVSAELTGKQILKLASKKGILAVTPDAPLRLSEGGAAPSVVSPPLVTGVPREGEVLSASTGEWAGDAPLSYGYQWQRCVAGGRAALVAADAPVGRWRLGEEGGATAVDAGGAGLDGAYVGAVRFGLDGVTGGADAAAGFDGAGAYVDVPGAAGTYLAGAFTLEVWVKATAAQRDRGILGTWSYASGGAMLWIDEAGNYGLAVTADHANYVTTSVAPTVGVWEHLVGSWDGTTLRLYRNGSEIGSQPFAGSTGASGNLELANYGDGSHGLNGALDEAALYDRALSPEQIRTHFLGCQPIAGATSSGYTATTADVGANLRVLVTASNGAGSTSRASEPTTTITAAPAPVAPAVVSPPVVAGVAMEGEALSASAGEWTGDAPLAYAYQWQRCGAAGRAAAAAADAPAGFWRLDEQGGATAVDAGGADLDGSYVGAVRFGVEGVSGGADGAAGFDGTSAYVGVAGIGNDSLAARFTLEAWVKAAAAQSDRGIVGKWSYAGGGVLLWIDQAGHYGLAVTTEHGNYVETSVAPTVGVWEHIVGTWDGTTLRLYRNGSEIGSKPFAGSPGAATADLEIANYADAGRYLNGAVDEVALYSRALTPDQVRSHYLGCQPIAGATGASYTTSAADLGSSLRVLVTASNSAGSASKPSEPTTAVTPVPRAPAPVSPPTLEGTPTEGETLTATNGTWTGDAPLAYAYQWQRCDAAGLACTDLPNATGKTFSLSWTDIGTTLRVIVRASNAAGGSSAPSQASTSIAEGSGYSSHQLWPYVARLGALWPATPSAGPQPPAIAIVDSGIDASRADFGGRVTQQVTLTSLLPNSSGDGRGHGTFVASIAAGELHGHTGAAPNAKLVSLDVFDDSGMATISDVIAAADWIYQNKDTYNIRVANFSLTGTVASSIQYDPLDRAVEKLWLSGVVVVAAAGNYADSGSESGVLYAPGNDPFVISVGAADTGTTLSFDDDVAAPWSAFGYTPDGFAKPELGAPGRYLVGAVPPGSTLALERPSQIVEPGYMQLSGTSFAAPVVSGAAAELLAAHPQWTPDQVKGALMVAAQPLPAAVPRSLGVGELDAAQAAAVADPPNANLALNDFLVPDPAGSPVPVFDAAAWGQAAASNPAWASAAWGQAAWGQAAWGQAAWGQTYWSSAAWGQGTDLGSTAPTSNAEGDVLPAGGYWITAAQLADAKSASGGN